VNLLLDTHALLWFLGGDSRLSTSARAAIENLENTRLFSVASAWEIAIKTSLGKLRLTGPFHELIPVQLRVNSIQLLPISPDHLNGLLTLPFHHRDPFDRILVSQAIVESATVVSTDATLDRYGVPRLW
jgi:PIN domain nuclease of toxin-antitoxin system